jgi:hypothetical protein
VIRKVHTTDPLELLLDGVDPPDEEDKARREACTPTDDE